MQQNSRLAKRVTCELGPIVLSLRWADAPVILIAPPAPTLACSHVCRQPKQAAIKRWHIRCCLSGIKKRTSHCCLSQARSLLPTKRANSCSSTSRSLVVWFLLPCAQATLTVNQVQHRSLQRSLRSTDASPIIFFALRGFFRIKNRSKPKQNARTTPMTMAQTSFVFICGMRTPSMRIRVHSATIPTQTQSTLCRLVVLPSTVITDGSFYIRVLTCQE